MYTCANCETRHQVTVCPETNKAGGLLGPVLLEFEGATGRTPVSDSRLGIGRRLEQPYAILVCCTMDYLVAAYLWLCSCKHRGSKRKILAKDSFHHFIGRHVQREYNITTVTACAVAVTSRISTYHSAVSGTGLVVFIDSPRPLKL